MATKWLPALFAIVASVALSSSGLASAYTADYHEWDLSCTADGYVLESRYPIVRTMGYGAGTQYVSGKETLYLGKSCDAFHTVFGAGTWCWANGGFVAEFRNDERIGFGRQELSCRDFEPSFSGNCGC